MEHTMKEYYLIHDEATGKFWKIGFVDYDGGRWGKLGMIEVSHDDLQEIN